MTDVIDYRTDYECDGFDPDPFAQILNWLGAVGSVASIVSWYEQTQGARQERWEREFDEAARYRCLTKITDVETDMALLEAQIGKIDILLRMAQGGTVNGQPMMLPPSLHQAPLQFGGIRLLLPDNLMKEFVRFHKETATISKRVGINVISLIQELSQYRIYVGPDAAHLLVEFREHLNRVLRSNSYIEAVAHCHETIRRGRDAMASLKHEFQAAFGGG